MRLNPSGADRTACLVIKTEQIFVKDDAFAPSFFHTRKEVELVNDLAYRTALQEKIQKKFYGHDTLKSKHTYTAVRYVGRTAVFTDVCEFVPAI